MTSYRQINSVLLLLLALVSTACSNTKPGIVDARLSPCPGTPNCVSSDAADAGHQIAPFTLKRAPQAAWLMALQQVNSLPRTKVVSVNNEYLHAECRSARFGFIDDLELHLRPAEGIIAVRSAARLGYSDLGVNRQRVDSLRLALQQQGAIE